MSDAPSHPASRAPVLVTMADTVPGREVDSVIGIARGSVVRARFFGRDFIAGLRNLVGGEVTEYTQLMAEAREQALGRLVAHAEQLGADAVVTFRFSTSAVMEGSAEILAYGTAVKLK
ncbi:YbjQ family protein [Maricaulaceae bacterium EIL42A08]|nr:YbjQ family protein [Maricaulaceae bacterium EIL42A08]